MMPTAIVLTSLILATSVTPPTIEGPDELRKHLEAGDLRAALDELRSGAAVEKGKDALDVAERLTELSAAAGVRRSDAGEALERAEELLQLDVPGDMHERRDELRARTGIARAAHLLAEKPAPRSNDHRDAIESLEAARRSLIALEKEQSKEMLRVCVLLAPLLQDVRRNYEVEDLAASALELGPNAEEQRLLELALANARLTIGKLEEAYPFLKKHVAGSTDAATIEPIASAFLKSKPSDPRILEFLQPVIAKNPDQQAEEAWRECLDCFYRSIERLSRKKEPMKSFWEERTIMLPIPTQWGDTTWGEGFRQWRPENTNPGKTYSGKDKISAVLPASAGWSRARVPPDLERWRNQALCFQRGERGPVLLINWYAPDLFYWYGTTPRARGVTGTGAQGHNRSGIASLVEDSCYGKEAAGRFRPSQPLPFSPARRDRPVRKQWTQGKTLYDESFFSIGQVTIEVVLRIQDFELEVLEPEIRWMYENIRSH